VQVQRWLGHHSAAFTLATHVHLLDGGVGEPLDLAAVLSANEVQNDPTEHALVEHWSGGHGDDLWTSPGFEDT
jgi:hypothetical protein